MTATDEFLRHDDLTIPQGVSFAIAWDLLDSEGNPLETAGWSARSQARRRIESDEVLASWSTEDGGLMFAADKVIMQFTPEQTAAWGWDVAYYDIKLEDPDGVPVRLTQGLLTNDKEATRD